MEASKRERLVLFGAVPIVAACIGALTTVMAQKLFGADVPGDAVLTVLRMEGITPEQRMQLLEQVNLGTTRFYSFLNTASIILLMPTAGILWAWATRIRN